MTQDDGTKSDDAGAIQDVADSQVSVVETEDGDVALAVAPDAQYDADAHATPAYGTDFLLIAVGMMALILIGVSAAAVATDRKWDEARRVLRDIRAELEARAAADYDRQVQMWNADIQRERTRLYERKPAESNTEAMQRWEAERAELENRTFHLDLQRAMPGLGELGSVVGDVRILALLDYQGRLQEWDRSEFILVQMNPDTANADYYQSETTGTLYVVEAIQEANEDSDGMLIRIYSNGMIEGPLPISESLRNSNSGTEADAR